MTKPKNALVKQMQVLFKMDGCNISFSNDAINKIASDAIEKKTGARALKTIIENLLLKTMYDLPDVYEKHKNQGVPIIKVTKESMDNNNEFEIICKKAA